MESGCGNSCTGGAVRYRHGWYTAKQLSTLWNNQPFCTTARPQADVARIVAEYVVAFLKTYLVGVDVFQQVLTPGWSRTHEASVEFFVTEPTSDDPNTFEFFRHQPGTKYDDDGGLIKRGALKDPIKCYWGPTGEFACREE